MNDDFDPGEHDHGEGETASGHAYRHTNCRELQYVEGRMPLHDGATCGPIVGADETECACGCTAFDEFCGRCYTPEGLNP